MGREVLVDPAGRTVERVRYRLPDRDVLVCRAPADPGKAWHTARTLGPGYVPGSGEVPVGPRMADGLAALGIDAATLRPMP